MSDLVRVTVAAGCHIVVRPHPSGNFVLGPLVLHGGNTADVTPERAATMYVSRLIHHPVTGEPPPPPAAMQDGRPRVRVEDGPFQEADGRLDIFPDWAATAAPPSSNPAPIMAPQPPPWSASVNTWDASPATITGADGRPWPNF